MIDDIRQLGFVMVNENNENETRASSSQKPLATDEQDSGKSIEAKPNGDAKSAIRALVIDAIRGEVGIEKINLTPEEEALLAGQQDPEARRQAIDRLKESRHDDQSKAR